MTVSANNFVPEARSDQLSKLRVTSGFYDAIHWRYCHASCHNQCREVYIMLHGYSFYYKGVFGASCYAGGWQLLTTGGGGDGGIKSGRTTTVLTKSGLSASFSSFCTVAELLSGKVWALKNVPAWVCCSKDGRKDCCEEVNAVGSARKGSHGDLHIMFNHHYTITLSTIFINTLIHWWLLLCEAETQKADIHLVMKGGTILAIIKKLFNWGKNRLCQTSCMFVREPGGLDKSTWRAKFAVGSRICCQEIHLLAYKSEWECLPCCRLTCGNSSLSSFANGFQAKQGYAHLSPFLEQVRGWIHSVPPVLFWGSHR